jgi:acetyl esterase/lipase
MQNPHNRDYTPTLSKNLKGFPNTYSVACGLDALRDDAIIMDNELKKAGVTTKIDVYPGLPHIFWLDSGHNALECAMGSKLDTQLRMPAGLWITAEAVKFPGID